MLPWFDSCVILRSCKLLCATFQNNCSVVASVGNLCCNCLSYCISLHFFKAVPVVRHMQKRALNRKACLVPHSAPHFLLPCLRNVTVLVCSPIVSKYMTGSGTRQQKFKTYNYGSVKQWSELHFESCSLSRNCCHKMMFLVCSVYQKFSEGNKLW